MRFEVFDYAQRADGSFAPGHAVTIYESDGTTPAILYTSEAGSGTTANPVISDSTGLVTCWITCPQPKKSVDGGPVTDLNVRSRGIAALSVRDKGARGNGIVDDSAALQAAIAASQRVVLPSGTYRLDYGVHIPSGTTIEGNGRSTVIYVSSVFNTADNKVLYNDGWDGAGATGITLRNLSFKVDNAAVIYSGAPFPRGVLAFGLVDGLVLENIYSQDLSCRIFCWLQSCKHVRVRGWDVRNLRGGVHHEGEGGGVLWSFAGYDDTHDDATWDAYDISVKDSTLMSQYDEALSIWGLDGATYDIDVSGNVLENVRATAYAFSCVGAYDSANYDGSVRDAMFCDNIVHGTVLLRNDCGRISLIGNVVRPNSGDNGFEIIRYDPANISPTAPQQIEIAKNMIYNSSKGIRTVGMLQSDVCENRIYGSTDSAITVTEFADTGDGGPADNSIRSNRLVSCAKGIYFSQAGVTVESNRARGTDVFIEGEATRDHGIDDTVIRGNYGYAYTDKGIWVRGHNEAQAGLLIEANTLEGDGVTSAYGVRVEYGAYTEAAALRNRVKNNATADYSVPSSVSLDSTIGTPEIPTSYGVNVRDYGAKGDGSTDDTAAFETACSVVVAAGGGTVYVPAGTYKVSSFTVPDGIRMAGEGMNTSIVAGTFLYSSNDVFTDLQIGANGVSLRSLKDANNSNVHDTQFKSCRFVGGPAAISFIDRRASSITFSDCVIQPNLAQSGDGVAIVERGTATMHFEHIEFIGCHFMGSSMFGFECIQRAPYDGYPVITGYRNINLIDCIFEPSAGQSISYDSNSLIDGQPCSGYSTVQGCLIKGAGADPANPHPHGLEFNSAGYMVCKNNTFYSCRGSLLNLNGDKVHDDTAPGIAMSITGNIFDMTKGIAHNPSGNLVMSNGSGMLLADNTFTISSTSQVFVLWGPNNLIENNTVTDPRPTSGCFLIYLDGAPNNTFRGNTFRAVGAHVRVQGGSSVSTFDSNTFVTGLTESHLFQINEGETVVRINNIYE